MSKRFELLVFDWDGTLMDSAAAIVASIQESCRDLGLPVPERERAAHVIGLGLRDALSYAVPELPVQDYGKLAERYRHHYLARDPDLELFPGMREILGLLQEGHEKGEVPATLDLEEAANFIVSGWHGSLIRMKIVKSTEPLENHKRFILHTLLKQVD